jgi:hypothetical protein
VDGIARTGVVVRSGVFDMKVKNACVTCGDTVTSVIHRDLTGTLVSLDPTHLRLRYIFSG